MMFICIMTCADGTSEAYGPFATNAAAMAYGAQILSDDQDLDTFDGFESIELNTPVTTVG